MAEESKNEDIRIDGDVATWEMNMVGAIKGTYIGTFRFRCYLTPLQQIQAGKEQRALLGENMALAPQHESFLAYALTQLKHRILSSPPFWASANPGKSLEGDLPDEDVIEAILDASVRAEIMYKDGLKKRKDEALGRANTGINALEEKRKKEESENQDKETSDKS